MTNGLLLAAIFSIIAVPIAISDVYAMQNTDSIAPTMIMPEDIYIQSQIPTTVNFSIHATDNVDGKLLVECDRTSGSIFEVGKTTVRCVAVDSAGNEARTSFVVTVGYNIVQIPSWVKGVTGFWIDQNISDEDYIRNLEFLLENEIISIPNTRDSMNTSEIDIPVWIKTNGAKWIDGNLTDDEFSIGILWLIDRGIVQF